jgi:hypothetical protein
MAVVYFITQMEQSNTEVNTSKMEGTVMVYYTIIHVGKSHMRANGNMADGMAVAYTIILMANISANGKMVEGTVMVYCAI